MTLTVRRVSAADAALLWEWRNDDLVRQNSFSTAPIPWDDHQRWLAARLASPATVIYIIEDGQGPVAQVRYERRADEADVGISVAASARGRGYGRAALTETLEDACAALGVRRIVALVKEDNVPSRRAFEGAGFDLLGSVLAHGARCHKYLYRAPEGSGAPA
jgi:RimJ/RimL family protein N-acetyltransferase